MHNVSHLQSQRESTFIAVMGADLEQQALFFSLQFVLQLCRPGCPGDPSRSTGAPQLLSHRNTLSPPQGMNRCATRHQIFKKTAHLGFFFGQTGMSTSGLPCMIETLKAKQPRASCAICRGVNKSCALLWGVPSTLHSPHQKLFSISIEITLKKKN